MRRTDRPLIVAVDGPAGAGKSSVSKILAARLGFTLVDTGAIYRCVALAARRQGIALDDDARLEGLVAGLEISFARKGDTNRVLLCAPTGLEGQTQYRSPEQSAHPGANLPPLPTPVERGLGRGEEPGDKLGANGGHQLVESCTQPTVKRFEDVSEAIRAPEISLAASSFSSRPVVRRGLLALQRSLALAAKTGAILEGRDIGTVVFPDADVKVFLSADPAVRAKRRHEELAQKGGAKSLGEVLAEQNRRDREDSEREVAPLKPAADAVQLDSTVLGLEEVVARIAALVAARR